MTIESDRFEFEPEITAKVLLRGERIYEVPISYAGRETSEGKKITWRDGVASLIDACCGTGSSARSDCHVARRRSRYRMRR